MKGTETYDMLAEEKNKAFFDKLKKDVLCQECGGTGRVGSDPKGWRQSEEWTRCECKG